MCNNVCQVCENYRRPVEMLKRIIIFNVQSNKVTCKLEDLFRQMGLLDLMV
jgi:hypothetical protein